MVLTLGQEAGSDRDNSSVSLDLLVPSEARAKSARFERTQPQVQMKTNLSKAQINNNSNSIFRKVSSVRIYAIHLEPADWADELRGHVGD